MNSNYSNDSFAIEEVILEKINYAIRYQFSDFVFQELRLNRDLVAEAIADAFIFRLDTFFYGKSYKQVIERVKYPADWWEAIKDRFLPIKLRKYIKIKYTEKDITLIEERICPHIDTISKKLHVSWLVSGSIGIEKGENIKQNQGWET